MKRFIAAMLVLLVFCTGAAAEQQKAPDFIMEGFDRTSANHIWETNQVFSRLQERSGISFQFRQHGNDTEWETRKGEILAGVNLPDVLFKAELNAEEVRDMYDAGVLKDLSPYLEQYAPNLWRLLEEHPDWKKAIEMPDGAIPALPNFNLLQSNNAMWINTDWLKKLGLEVPRTAEELTDVLRAFKTGDPNRNGRQDEIPLGFIGMWDLRFLAHAFGITDNDYYLHVTDGKVTSSLTTDENRAFLTWLHTLWEEGLLDRNGFYMSDSMRQVTDDSKPATYGVFLSFNPLAVVDSKLSSQYSLLMPLEYQGKSVYRDLLGDVIRGTFAVTSACSEPEKLVAWVDYFYTEEGYRLAQYGEENTDYFWNEDGLWEWNASLQEVSERILPEDTLSEGGVIPGLTGTEFQLKYADTEARGQMEQLYELKKTSVIPYPPVTVSREDAERIGVLQKGIMGYAEKTMACFVTGDLELSDENWDTFCTTVEDLGIQEMIGIWQKYLPEEPTETNRE